MLHQDHFEKLIIVILVLDGPCMQKNIFKKPAKRRTMPQNGAKCRKKFHDFCDILRSLPNPSAMRIRCLATETGRQTRKPASVQLNPLGPSGPFYHATPPFSAAPFTFKKTFSMRVLASLGESARGSSPNPDSIIQTTRVPAPLGVQPSGCSVFDLVAVLVLVSSILPIAHPPKKLFLKVNIQYSALRTPHSALERL
jgi:hypothetical protein